MSEFLRRLVCLALGHVRTEWVPAVWAYVDATGWPTESRYTSNVPTEIRFCLRCSFGYESRWAS